MLAWKIRVPSREKVFSCGWSPEGNSPTITPRCVSMTLTLPAVEAETSRRVPSGESARAPGRAAHRPAALGVVAVDLARRRGRDEQTRPVRRERHVVGAIAVDLHAP